jgi:hypothetical protein
MVSTSAVRIVPDILSRVKISEVWRALGGPELRRTGSDAYRGSGWWRGGQGLNVSLNDAKNTYNDFVSGHGGGLFDLVVLVRGGTRADALRWLADLAGVPLDDKPLSAADRARWAAERREFERDLPEARYWRRAAVTLSEELLAVLKASFIDPTAEDRPSSSELQDLTFMLASLERMGDAALVAEYRTWAEREPQLTAGMVHAARLRERAEVRALLRYLIREAA